MTMPISHKTQVKERTLVVGLGKTGLSCVRFLVSHGEQVAVTDSRVSPPGLDVMHEEFPDVPVFVGGFKPEVFHAATQLIISPGVPLQEPQVAETLASGVPVFGDIELFARYADAPVVAITGSNGKSTVTSLFAEMAKHARNDVRVGGNLGQPALELLSEVEPDLYVLELSSFQLETVQSLNAKSATVLNVSPDHMDRYQDMQEYALAKQHIFNGDGVMVLNADDPVVKAMDVAGRPTVFFGMGVPQGDGHHFGVRKHNDDDWFARGDEVLMPVSKMRLFGHHNIINVLAALALGDSVGLPMEAMLQAISEFSGLPHRCQWVAQADGVTWYNDSKGTNVGAAIAAVEGIEGQVIWIAGGQGKGADFAPLKSVLPGKVRAALLMGQDASLIEQAIQGVVPVHHVGDMSEAVSIAKQLAQAGDSVLLSPACASFDMFADYQERGDIFMKEVRGLLS